MEKTARNKWQVRVAALAVFVLGFAAGALALNAYQSWSRAAGRENRRGRFEQVLERLQLTGEQKTEVRQILADARGQMRAIDRESEPRRAEIRQRTDERLQKVLTPEQWEQFQRMKDEMRGPRRRGRGGRGGGGEGDDPQQQPSPGAQ